MADRHTVLFVDDESNILNALKRAFRRDDFDVLTADSGADGLALLAEKKVTVIVSDQRMPGMIGAEFLARSREVAPHAVRLMLTGYSDVETATQAINEGQIHRFVTKPWDDEELRRILGDAMGRYDLEARNRQLTADLQQKTRDLEELNTTLEGRVAERTQELRAAMDELALRVRELEGRDRIARHLLEYHSLEDNLVTIAEIVSESLALRGVVFYLPAAAGWRCVAAPETAWSGEVDAENLEGLRRTADSTAIADGQGLLVPVARGERILGAMAALGAETGLTREQSSALTSFALQAAIAISDEEAQQSIDDWDDDEQDLERMLSEAAEA